MIFEQNNSGLKIKKVFSTQPRPYLGQFGQFLIQANMNVFDNKADSTKYKSILNDKFETY